MNHMIINGQYAPEVQETATEQIEPTDTIKHLVSNIDMLNSQNNKYNQYRYEVLSEDELLVLTASTQNIMDLYKLCELFQHEIHQTNNYTFIIE